MRVAVGKLKWPFFSGPLSVAVGGEGYSFSGEEFTNTISKDRDDYYITQQVRNLLHGSGRNLMSK